MGKFRGIFIPFIFFLCGFLVSFYFFQKNVPTGLGYSEQHSGQNRLVNKLLDFDIPPSNELGTFKNDLQNMVNSFIKSGKASQVGVYYRDLNSGPWVGVNESMKFIPASLLKVPLMMVYLKKAETNPAILSKKYTFHESDLTIDTSMHYSQNSLEDGKEYTVQELLQRMLTNSDNDALYILSTNVDVNEQKELYAKFGFPIPDDITSSEPFMSPRNYASFFRVLYNATYLDEDTSEKALQMLTKTDFPYGIVAGVPKNIIVAQKYGERSTDNQAELHDCGIVYYPNHPYALCIMTKGTNFDDLSSVIKNISKITYETVKKSN